MAGVPMLLRRALGLLWSHREFLLAVALGAWLGGYFLQDGWEQRRAFRFVVPILALNADLLARTFRETRWLWAVAVLLAFQALSRLWSGQAAEPVSNPLDTLVVLALTTSLVLLGRHERLARGIVTWLVLLATGVTLYSLASFYGPGGHRLAGDRLRNVFIYREEALPGLNAVLTGILCAFGAVGAAWGARRDDWPLRRSFWLACLGVLVFGLMATQSRGAMLAGLAGLGVLVCFLRSARRPVLVTIVLSILIYSLALLLPAGAGASHLIERGSSGRFEIYLWFLERVRFTEIFIGRGMASSVTIPEGELGWFVHHPHSAYLTQFLQTGLLGLGILMLVMAWAGGRAVLLAFRDDALWLSLLACGATALLFDCAQVFSIYSAPRIEFLVLVVPAALLMGRATPRALSPQGAACLSPPPRPAGPGNAGS